MFDSDWRGRSGFDPCVIPFINSSVTQLNPVLCVFHRSAPQRHYSHLRQDFLPPTNSITAAIGMQIHCWDGGRRYDQIAANSLKCFKSALFIIIPVHLKPSIGYLREERLLCLLNSQQDVVNVMSRQYLVQLNFRCAGAFSARVCFRDGEARCEWLTSAYCNFRRSQGTGFLETGSVWEILGIIPSRQEREMQI